MERDKEAQSVLRKEKAALSAKLLDAAKAKQPSVQGKIVNDFGQEEAGVPRWQQKAQAKKDMYASCATTADVSHEQRILKQLEAKKAAKAAAAARSQAGGGCRHRLQHRRCITRERGRGRGKRVRRRGGGARRARRARRARGGIARQVAVAVAVVTAAAAAAAAIVIVIARRKRSAGKRSTRKSARTRRRRRRRGTRSCQLLGARTAAEKGIDCCCGWSRIGWTHARLDDEGHDS